MMDYEDSDGRKCDLPTMCRREPEWAANRLGFEIEEGKRIRSQLATAEAALDQYEAEMALLRQAASPTAIRAFRSALAEIAELKSERTRPPLAIPEDVLAAWQSVRRYIGHSGAHEDACDATDTVDAWFSGLPTTPPVASEQEAKDAALGAAVRAACDVLSPNQIAAVEHVDYEDDMGARELRVIDVAQRDILEAVAEHLRQEQKS